MALYTGTVSPHQLPLAREIVKRIGARNYRYIYTSELDVARKSFGWNEAVVEPWCVSVHNPEAPVWLESCEVLVTAFRDCDLIERRAEKGLRTWYCNERWFKPVALGWLAGSIPGQVRMLVPGFRRMAKRFVKLVNRLDAVGILAMGPWSAADFMRIGVRPDKIVPWGYFVEKGSGGGGRRRDGGDVLKVLWAGRDIPLKRVKDIERAVALAKVPLSFTKLTGVKAAEVRQAMLEHDVFVFASNAQEGWGAVVSEALEEGMRVIGTLECGACPVLLPQERLYHSGDVKALAKLLVREFRGELPPCSIGEWTAAAAAQRLVTRCGWKE